MPLIEWSDEKLSVKVGMIDRQHKKMVGMINELYDSVEAKREKELLAQLLIKLVHYTHYHFATEEKYFKEYKYPEMMIHKAQHDQLRVQVAALDERYYTGDKMITSEVMKLLNDWLFDHIIGSDRKFGQFLNGKGTFLTYPLLPVTYHLFFCKAFPLPPALQDIAEDFKGLVDKRHTAIRCKLEKDLGKLLRVAAYIERGIDMEFQFIGSP